MGKGGGSQPTITTYYAGVHFVLCHGPIDKITKILVDEKVAWEAGSTGGNITINAPELFGGNIREGGISGTVSLEFGEATQTPNTYLQSKLGAEIPAYRKVVSAILNNVYLGTNYYLKPWSFEAVRVHTRGNGIAQWYDATAEISSSYGLAFSIITFDITVSPTQAVIKTYRGHGINALTTVTVSGATDSLYNRTFVPVAITDDEIRYNLAGTPSNPASGDNLRVTVHVSDLINAVHVIRDCLTDTTWGFGYPESLFPDSNWQAAALQCYNEGLGFGFFWDGQQTLDKFIDDVAEHIQAAIYKSRVDGKYYINLLRPVANPGVLLDLSDHIVEISNFSKQSLYDLTSIYTVKYKDNASGKNNETTVQDFTLFQRQGKPVKKTKTYNGVVDLATAHKLATRDLLEITTPTFSFSLKTDRTAENLNKGDAFTITIPEYSSEQFVMRVVSIDLGTPEKGQITIECVQDVFHAATHEFAYFTASIWESPLSQPAAATVRFSSEIPYYVLARTKGDQFAQGVPDTESYIICAAQAPASDSYGAGIWTTAATDFQRNGFFDFCYSSTILAALTRTSTTIQVASTEDIDLLNIGFMVQIDAELMVVTDITGDLLTVTRGVCDTVPEIHAINSRLFAWHDYFGSDQIVYVTGETVKLKITPATPRGELDATQAPQDSIPIAGRMHMPYPPANVKFDGLYWPEAVLSGTFTVTWATRNRLTQTTTTINGFYEGNITSEPSVLYSGTLRRVSDDGVIDSFTDLNDVTYTFTAAVNEEVYVTLWSTRLGVASYQSVVHQFYLSSGWLEDEFGIPITTEFGEIIDI